jgi:ferrous iron transport protein A
MTKDLGSVKSGERGRVAAVTGDDRFLGRITAIGLTVGCEVEIVRNHESRPVLLYARDTMIAVNRKESAMVMVDVRDERTAP